MKTSTRWARQWPLIAIAAALGACSPTLDIHGNIPKPEIVEGIAVGETTRDQVSGMLGTPSAVATFDQDAWYYVGKRTSRVAFLEPEILERQVLVIRFDENGVVRQVEKLDKEDGRAVAIVARATPTRGRELTIIEQLIGNIGRFGGGGTGAGPGSAPGGG